MQDFTGQHVNKHHKNESKYVEKMMNMQWWIMTTAFCYLQLFSQAVWLLCMNMTAAQQHPDTSLKKPFHIFHYTQHLTMITTLLVLFLLLLLNFGLSQQSQRVTFNILITGSNILLQFNVNCWQNSKQSCSLSVWCIVITQLFSIVRLWSWL